MLCSICKSNESIVSISIFYSGNKKDIHVCSDCVNKYGLNISNIDELIKQVSDLIKNRIIKDIDFVFDNEELEDEIFLLSSVLSVVSSGKAEDFDDNRNKRENTMVKQGDVCIYCGTSIEDIISSGHLGCVGCFEHFRHRIKSKPVRFEGRVPKVYRYIYIQDKLISYLLNRMTVEVTRENFEEASKIKNIVDKIVK